VWFEWGDNEENISKDSATQETMEEGDVFASEIVFEGAQFGETYYFRAVAESEHGKVKGAIRQFTITLAPESDETITLKYGEKKRFIGVSIEGIIEIFREEPVSN